MVLPVLSFVHQLIAFCTLFQVDAMFAHGHVLFGLFASVGIPPVQYEHKLLSPNVE